MTLTSASLLLLLLVSSLCPIQGVLEAYNTRLKCRCSQETSAFVSPRFIDQLQIFPRGNGCPKTEIILWMKNMSIKCVNPQAKWIRKIMDILQKKKKVSSSPVQ
ncbi:C-X-C motif chemokine 13 [Nycticebus coucang]|uniref:C-X-C motif chemokine 13 n=1 Tax=Nycticebus coucang TaxID=9470 RepID=UPI00234DA9AC|nr:C-X-C motif chemokine 13 [Nycticebus coucang]